MKVGKFNRTPVYNKPFDSVINNHDILHAEKIKNLRAGFHGL